MGTEMKQKATPAPPKPPNARTRDARVEVDEMARNRGERAAKAPNRATLEAIEELESGRGYRFDNVEDLFRALDIWSRLSVPEPLP